MSNPKHPASTAAGPESHWPRLLAVLALTVFSLVLGYILVENAEKMSFWYDELWSLDAVSGSLGRMTQLLRDDFHPPGYHFLLYGWVRLVGDSEIAARSLSISFLIATLPLTYFFGLKLGLDRAGAVLGAGLISYSNAAIFYGVETRPYAMLLFITLATLYLLMISSQGEDRRAYWASAILGVLALYSHYAALFVLVPAAFLFALQNRDRRILWLALLWTVALLPWAIQIKSQAQHFNQMGWLKAPTWLSAADDMFKLLGFQAAAKALGILYTVVVIEMFRRRVGTQHLWLLLPPLVAMGTAVVSHWVIPVFHPRYLFTLLPFVGLAVGFILQPVRPVPLRWGIAMTTPLICAFLIYGSWKDVTVKAEDWRGPAQFALSRQDEANIFVTTENSRFFRHYIPNIVILPEDDQAAVERWLQQTGRVNVWFLQARQYPGTPATRTVARKSAVLRMDDFPSARALLLQLQP